MEKIVLKCLKCGTQLSDSHKQALLNALSLPQGLSAHLRDLKNEDCLCEECFKKEDGE